jgi:hypothetical protein
MNATKWALLGACAGLAGIAVNKQLRLARHRNGRAVPDLPAQEAQDRASIDDVPTVQAAGDPVAQLDEEVAPAAPL